MSVKLFLTQPSLVKPIEIYAEKVDGKFLYYKGNETGKICVIPLHTDFSNYWANEQDALNWLKNWYIKEISINEIKLAGLKTNLEKIRDKND